MAYSRTTWANNTTPAINESHLNNIETGLYNLHLLESEIEADIAICNAASGNSISNSSDVDDRAEAVNDLNVAITSDSTDANMFSELANADSTSANATSSMANSIIDTNTIYGLPDELIDVCESRLCKVVDTDEFICKYSAGILMVAEGADYVVIIEEPEEPDPLLGN